MKQKKLNKKIFLLLLALIGFAGMKAQTPGTSSVNPIIVTSGTSSLMSQSPDATEKWYKITPSQTNILIRSKLTTQSYTNSLVSTQLFITDLSNNVLYSYSDSLNPDSTTIFAFTNFDLSRRIYLKYNFDNSCGACTSTPTKFNILINEAASNLASCPFTNFSCNMVRNPSFENFYVPCSNLGLGVYPVCDWQAASGCTTTAAGTPDYLNNCGFYPLTFSYTPFYTGANTGSGASGIYLFGDNSQNTTPTNNGTFREYIQNQMVSTLIPGKTYQLAMYTKAMPRQYFMKELSVFFTSTYPCQNQFYNNINTGSYTGQKIDISSSVMTNTVWQKYVVTFTAGGNYDKITIGNFNDDASTTKSLQPTWIPFAQGGGNAYYNIDDISILTPSVSITSPVYVSCPSSTLQFNPLNCEMDNHTYTYSWSPSTGLSNPNILNPVVISGNSSQIYTLTQTGIGSTGTIVTTTTVNLIYTSTLTLAATSPTYGICSNFGQSATITATTNSSTTPTWQPGNLSGPVQVVSPTVTTVYTVSVVDNGCTYTATSIVSANNSCCTSTNPAFVGTAFPTTTLVGLTYGTPLVFQNDVTIPTGISVTLSNTEFLFAPNVKLIVSPGAVLQLRGSHLYACGTSMWQGIVIQDGGAMTTVTGGGNNVLIEDAITAVDITNNTTSTLTTIASLVTTIFNKNYIGVKVDNYQRNFASNPVSMNECVFSSRNFTFTPTSWPKTTTTSPGLRFAATATTGLAVPYLLQSAAIVNLKAPYTNQSARIGVQINNSGITSGNNYYGIDLGSSALATNFNLFDALMFGVDATNSNFSSINNVYQNTQRVYFCPRCYYDGGSAIRSIVNTNLNARINMTAAGTNSTSYSVGNRFWNCHRAVEATNVYRLDCNYGTFRSTQTSTTAPSSLLLPGNYGISNNTNRFEHTIRYNKFSNINTAIVMNVSPGTYTYGANSYSGILANNLFIDFNYFGAQLTNGTGLGTAFLNNAVYLTSTSISGWNYVGTLGLRVESNEINRAFRGVYVDAFAYPSQVTTNTVSLLNDNYLAVTQRGISAGNTPNIIIANNKLNAVNTTNTLVTLVYLGSSVRSAVTCNTLSTSYQAFEFNSNSTATTWKGNSMTTHARGLVLSTNGIIGQQGASGAPIDNKWNSGITNMTYLDLSDAVNSILYTKVGSPWQTTSNNGNVGVNQLYSFPGNTVSATGTYVCGSVPPPAMMAQSSFASSAPTILNSNTSSTSAEEQYITDNTTYRYLEANPSVKNSNSAYVNFYNSKANSSMDKFKQAELSLSNGQIAQAQSINSSANIVNAVESNYKNYYTVYAKFKNYNFTSADSAILINLAKLCPGMDGAIVYQARALYNLIYNTVKLYKDDCTASNNAGSRFITTADTENKNIKTSWNVELFPNPTSSELNIVSKAESENLTVIVRDMAGKVVYSQNLLTNNFISKLDLDLVSGIYLVTINNNNNESTTKKLVITK